MSKKIKKAILPVGGLGTRFLPATKTNLGVSVTSKFKLPIIIKSK